VDAAVERAARLLEWARPHDIPIAHVGVRYRPGYPEIDRELPLFRDVLEANALADGTWGAEFDPRAAPLPGEWMITKHGVDAFAHNDLALLCRLSSRRTLLLSGVQTDAVVLCTALTAGDHGLRPVVIEDGCAGSSLEGHTAA